MDRDRQRYIENRLSGLRRVPEDNLQGVAQSILVRAEKQRKEMGAAYGLQGLLGKAAKDFVAAIEGGAPESVLQEYGLISEELWFGLRDLDLPTDKAWQHDSETAQELVEGEGVRLFHPALSPEAKIDDLAAWTRQQLEKLWTKLGDPRTDSMLAVLAAEEDRLDEEAKKKGEKFQRQHLISINYQAWLGGVVDIPGELWKMVTNKMLAFELGEESQPMEVDQRKLLYAKLIKISRACYQFLENFQNCYGGAINNSRRRGFFNQFRGRVFAIARAMEEMKKPLTEISNRQACDRQMLSGAYSPPVA